MTKKIGSVLVALVFAIWLMWIGQEWVLATLGVSWTIADRGQWGDTFGALNALVSALAFSAVLYTLWSQQQQISNAQIDQHKQRFDDTFFRLLSLQREVRKEARYTLNGKAEEGEKALQAAADDASIHLRNMQDKTNREKIVELYSKSIYRKAEAVLGPYFRLIYTTLKRIDEDRVLSEAEKIVYANLLRGQLGSPEVALLALNGLLPESKDLSVYLNRFRMLKYLTIQPVRDCVKPHYEPTAFEARD